MLSILLTLPLLALADTSDVVQLTTSTFTDFTASNPLSLIEFFAPWCGHCKALAPEYEIAATELLKENIKIAKVDCTEEGDLCQEQGVQGYPTLKESTPYQGARKSDAIVSYMIKQSLPSVSIIDSVSFDEFTEKDKVVIIGYFNTDDHNKTFTAAADSLRDDFLFGATSDPVIIKSEGITSLPAVVIYKSFDDKRTVYDGAFEAKEISDYVKRASIPLLGEIGPDTYTGYMQSGLPLAYIFTEQDTKQDLTELFQPFAKLYKGKLNFATIDAALYGQHAANLNLKAEWPAFAIQDPEKNTKYPFDQTSELEEDAVKTFLSDYIAGKIEPSVKSEEIPTTQGPVTVIVGKSYQDVVHDTSKDVLVEFYAPWCGHCKNLAPKYEELGELYAAQGLDKKVTIAKVDATANDVPDDIKGFPTIKLYPAKNKAEPIEYNGDRTIESFIEFIAEHGSFKASVTVAPSGTFAAAAATEQPTVADAIHEDL